MRGRERNTAFFRQQGDRGEAKAYSQIFRSARASGKLDLSSRQLITIPNEAFDLQQNLEEGEKFWEINPLSKLDLSHNLISELPADRFDRLSADLVYLKIRDNKLRRLPEDLFSCILLRVLDLGSNQLEDLPQAVGNCEELRELFLNDNNLETLPATLSRCRNLQTIELQHNRLSVISVESLMNLSLLQVLNLSKNLLTELPVAVSNLPSLDRLDISGNKLTTIPDLMLLRELKFLDASENKLTTLPSLPEKGKLDRLYLRENRISTLPTAEIAKVASTLTELLLQGNCMSICPDDIALLSKLKILDISNNDLGTLPHTLGYMSSLSKLLVEGNPIRVIRRSLLSTPQAEDLKAYLRTRGPPPTFSGGGDSSVAGSSRVASQGLDAAGAPRKESNSNTGGGTVSVFAAVDEELCAQIEWRIRDSTGGSLELTGINMCDGDFTGGALPLIVKSHVFGSLTSLNLSSNKLTAIPLELAELQSLRQLRVSNNQLGSSYPSEQRMRFQAPSFLTLLDVSANKLTTRDLETILTSFDSLSELLASSNNIDAVPSSILRHRRLRVLIMSNNRVKGFDGLDFSALKSLEVMDFSSNQLQQLDVSLPPSVNTLLLTNNDIRDLPLELATLPLLRTLTLVGNPIKNIRPSVIAQGADAILNVLRIRLPAPPQAVEADQPSSATQDRIQDGYEKSPRPTAADLRGVDSGVDALKMAGCDRSRLAASGSKQQGSSSGTGRGDLKAEARHAALDMYRAQTHREAKEDVSYSRHAPAPPLPPTGSTDHSSRFSQSKGTGASSSSGTMADDGGSKSQCASYAERAEAVVRVSREAEGRERQHQVSRIPSAAGGFRRGSAGTMQQPPAAQPPQLSRMNTGSSGGSGGIVPTGRGMHGEIPCQRLSGGGESVSGKIQVLTAEIAALEEEMQNSSSNLRKIEIRKAVAVKRANILRLQSG